MKLQASFEFLIILSAVAGFAVFAVWAYGHVQAAQSLAYNGIGSMGAGNAPAANYAPRGGAGPYIFASAQNVSYVGQESRISVLLSYPSGYTVGEVYANSTSNATITPAIYSRLPNSGMDIVSFGVVAGVAGSENVTVHAVFSNGTTTTVKSYSVYMDEAYASAAPGGGGGGAGSAFSAYIVPHNESTVYGIGSPMPLGNFSYWTHCAYHSWFGNRENEVSQCGGGTWGLIVTDYGCNPFYGDGQDRYYCFSANPGGDYVQKISQNGNYIYNATLYLYNQSMRLSAGLVSGYPVSSLYSSAGGGEGFAVVGGVYDQAASSPPYASQIVLNMSKSLSIANMSNYTQYASTVGGLVNQLKAYNGTWADPSVVSLLTESIQAADAYRSRLLQLGGPVTSGGCKIWYQGGPAYYLCKDGIPLSFNLTANVTGIAANQSVVYRGSIIQVV